MNDTVDRIVEALLRDLGDRRAGFDIGSLHPDTAQELRDDWARIIRKEMER